MFRSLDDSAVRGLLKHDWRHLFPMRHGAAQQICRILDNGPATSIDAKVAFGLLPANLGSDWLYRDFYVETPPAMPGVERAIGKLRRGDTREIMKLLSISHAEHVFRRVWYEISTLAGRVIEEVIVERDGVESSACFELMPQRSRFPARLVNQDQVAGALRQVLCQPIGIEPHRLNLIHSMSALANGAVDGIEADHRVTMLMHHTDVAPRKTIPWSSLPLHQREELKRAVVSFQNRIASPRKFLGLLRDGLASPSRQRRFLSYRLLRLDGHIGTDSHPDDQMFAV